MTYYDPRKIEKLGERILWMTRHLAHNHLCLGDPHKPLSAPDSLAAVYRTVCELKPALNLQKQMWGRYAKGTTSTPVAIIDALHDLYPTMGVDTLTAPEYSSFTESTASMTRAFARWEQATKHVATNRDSLAKLAKAYYRSADDSRNYLPVTGGPIFPLITASGWLLDKPVPLSEEDPVASFNWNVDDKTGYHLEDWPYPYWLIKKRALPASRRDKLTNGKTFRVSEVKRIGDRLELHYSPGDYFNYIDTCEVLGVELADFVIRSPNRLPGPSDLPLRGQPGNVFDFRTRSAFPGVNCLLILKNYLVPHSGAPKGQTADRFLMHYRSGTTLEAPKIRHVVPAGGHQPVSEGYEEEADQSIWRSVARELVEEVFNKEEASRIHQSGVSFWDHPEVKPVVDGIFRKAGTAKVYLMGMGLDPVTTKPELLVAIVVDWPKFRQATAGFPIRANYEGEIEFCELTRPRLLVEALGGAGRSPVQPAGAACLLLAHKFFEHLTV